MKIVFLSDCNGFEYKNPVAWLVDIKADVTIKDLKELESKQIGALRSGGDWVKIMKDGGFEYELLEEGRKSDFKKHKTYTLISGNY